jgi:hypothetical protein
MTTIAQALFDAFRHADRVRTHRLAAMHAAEEVLELTRCAYQRADHDRDAAVYACDDEYRRIEHEAGRAVTATTH